MFEYGRDVSKRLAVRSDTSKRQRRNENGLLFFFVRKKQRILRVQPSVYLKFFTEEGMIVLRLSSPVGGYTPSIVASK